VLVELSVFVKEIHVAWHSFLTEIEHEPATFINVFKNHLSSCAPSTERWVTFQALSVIAARTFCSRTHSRKTLKAPMAASSTGERLLLWLLHKIFLVRFDKPIVLGCSRHQLRPCTVTVSVRNSPAVTICSPVILSEQSPNRAAQQARMLRLV
jgi:hypothetical protein